MKRRRTNIRQRILAVFSIMLFLSFSLIGIIFNVAVGQFIRNSAASQLNAAYNNMMQFVDETEILIVRQPDGTVGAPDGALWAPPDDSGIQPNDAVRANDGSDRQPNDVVRANDGSGRQPNDVVRANDGSGRQPNDVVRANDGSGRQPGGTLGDSSDSTSATPPDDSDRQPDGASVAPNGELGAPPADSGLQPDGTIETSPDGTIEGTVGASNYPESITAPSGVFFAPPPNARNTFRISANLFLVDDKFNLQNSQSSSDEEHEIARTLEDNGERLASLRNELITTGGGAYYVSAFKAPDNPMADGGEYFIVYADVTSFIRFAASINTILIVLVCPMFVLTIFITLFLSNSITRPIKKLCSFASGIGNGVFVESGYKFIDNEFESLNVVLNNTAKQLSIYDSEQKTFFQNVSHELRTPLMSIKCQAEGVTYDLIEPKKACETILQETDRLSELVTDLLYISKIDNITTVYKTMKTDILGLIRSCAQRQETVAHKKGIKFTFDFIESEIEYDCAGELISRAVDNLISNAIRYALSEIVLSCRVNSTQITICVTDDGEGIEPDSIPHIFERFYKGSGGNHGIGLSIVKSIIQQHRGNVTAENTASGGAKFIVTLPITQERNSHT
ncbi:MAG: HAMP domain-containing histidine kinase [Oscillospiraceae bacterium]|nr:HAMP domain-containing histidine kinase [Oscillospiraceae bacterium]